MDGTGNEQIFKYKNYLVFYMHCIERCDAISESNAPEPRPKNTILKYNGLKSLEQVKGPGKEQATNRVLQNQIKTLFSIIEAISSFILIY